MAEHLDEERRSPVDELTECFLRARKCEDRQLYGQVFEAVAPGIWAFAFQWTGNSADADEILQDTLLRLWASRGRFDPTQGSIKTWASGIKVNVCREYSRRKRRRADTEVPINIGATEPVAPLPPPYARIELNDEVDALRLALKSLPPIYREVLLLCAYEGLRYRQIAELLGIPVGTVKSRMAEAKERLAAARAKLRALRATRHQHPFCSSQSANGNGEPRDTSGDGAPTTAMDGKLPITDFGEKRV